MFCKIIDITDKIVTLISGNGDIIKINSYEEICDNEELFKKYGKLIIINGFFDRKVRSYKILVNYNSITDYNKLINISTPKLQKICAKAKVLGLQNKHKEVDGTLIIGDYNSILEGNISTETVEFIGYKPLVKSIDIEYGIGIQIKCKKAIIVNHCVMSNLLLSRTRGIIVVANEYILSHDLMDKHTVEEIFYILSSLMETKLNFDVMQKILIDTTKLKDSEEDLISMTLRLIKNTIKDTTVSKLAILATAMNISESLNFKYSELNNAIVDFNNYLIRYENDMSLTNRIRYQRLRQNYQNIGN